MLCGIAVHIAHGKHYGVLQSIIRGDGIGTHFVPEEKVSGIKRRLAYADGFSMGTIVVNKRAGDMLSAKAKAMSILPVGIVRVEKKFQKGDIVEIVDESGKEVGFGIAASDAKTIDAAIGKQGARPAVHYNYLLIT
jgi:glutamate 5-kinase